MEGVYLAQVLKTLRKRNSVPPSQCKIMKCDMRAFSATASGIGRCSALRLRRVQRLTAITVYVSVLVAQEYICCDIVPTDLKNYRIISINFKQQRKKMHA
jgi:hypothetical protein